MWKCTFKFSGLAGSPRYPAEIPASERGSLWVAHDDFHAALISAWLSEWILYFCKLMYQHAERYRFLWQIAAVEENHQRNVLQEHEEPMKAAIDRDAVKACTLLREHFWRTTTLILETAPGFLVPGTHAKKPATPDP
jgi:DNA-binding GntR family transcriptional regulator